jgi:hypothetical protein
MSPLEKADAAWRRTLAALDRDAGIAIDRKGRDEIDRRCEARWAACDEGIDDREGR